MIEALTNTTSKNSMFFAGMIIGCAITVAGLLIFFDTWKQSSLQPVVGTVTDSKIERQNVHTSGETGHREYWKLSVSYTYTTGGKVYVSSRYSSSPPKSDAKDDTPPSQELKRLLAEYPIGRKIDVFISPSAPEKAFLNPTKSADWRILAVGILILFATFYIRRKMS